MSNNFLEKPVRGISPPMVTPLHGRDALDVAGFQRELGGIDIIGELAECARATQDVGHSGLGGGPSQHKLRE